MDLANTIIIADDHPLFRSALKGTLNTISSSSSVVEAGDLASLQDVVEANQNAKLILLDLNMPGVEGFSALVYLAAHYPQIPVMIVSAHEAPDVIRKAMDYGASGFLPKSSTDQEISNALSAVLDGGVWVPEGIPDTQSLSDDELSAADALASLTPKQFRVATMVGQGMLNKQIAYELDVTEATIKAHMTEIFKKLGVHSRMQVALKFNQLGADKVSLADEFE